ncbi:MAG: glycosyltransferase family 2 protein [Sulfurimonas sp.]|nr:glycosyltransferase family 2 protein [Sulfurimonas sp.]
MKYKNMSDTIMMHKTVTVVTVTYNAVEYLEETIKSVLEQDYANLEYIIIDGKSTDGTIDIIKKYQKYLAYWISEPDDGVYDAMNKGINAGTGDWINFMNAGDSFASSCVLTDVITAMQEGTKILTGFVNVIDQEKEWIYTLFPMKAEDVFTEFRCNHQATFTRMDIAKKILFDLHYKYASDVDFFMRSGLDKASYQVVPFPIVNFLQGGLWQQNVIYAHIEILNIMSRYLPNMEDIFHHTSFLELHLGLYQNSSIENVLFNHLFNRLAEKLQKIQCQYKKIALYGYGHAGKFCELYLKNSIAVIVDKGIALDSKTVYHPNQLSGFEYDCILISVLGREQEIISYLHRNIGIEKSKIITL